MHDIISNVRQRKQICPVRFWQIVWQVEAVPAVPVREELDDMIHIEEVRKAVKQMKCNKASGGDGIPAEVYKYGGTALVRHLHRLFLKIWKHEEVPQELKDASIVTIFKKGSRTECGNYRGISLLSVAGKILAKVLLNRLQPLSESIIPETQCGFRPGRGTTDMIFSARQVQEKCREQGRDLCLAFIDLTKAFDSVNREACGHASHGLDAHLNLSTSPGNYTKA